MIQYGNRIARGLGLVQGSVYLDGDRTPRQVREVFVADGSGGARQTLYRFGVTEQPSGIVYAVLDVEERQYKLTGTVTPVGKTVRVSNVTGADITPELLEGGVVASTASDGEGKFEISTFQGWSGKLAVWADIEPNFLEGTASNIQCSLTDPEGQTSSGDSGAAPGSGGGTCVTCGGTGVVQEACTECNGAGSIEAGGEQCPSCEGRGYFEVTCPDCSGTGNDGTCLAGHTLVTMADGKRKRLEDVRPGDLLLAGDGTPTPVLRVARGRINPFHTLYRFEDGTVIDEVHDHRFFNVEAGFWQVLRRWRIGDHARRQDGAEVALAAVEQVNRPAEMCNLWTGSRDYWAEGLLAGEIAANQPLLMEATAEQAAEMAASLEERTILNLLEMEDALP